MTREETGMIMAILKAAYPNWYRGLTREDALGAINLWTEMFADDRPEEVAAAVKILIAGQKEGYPPTIGAVKERLYRLRRPEERNGQEAWALVKKAVRAYCLYAKPEENPYYKLPREIQRAVGGPGQIRDWAMMEEEAFDTVEGSHFKKAYAMVKEREKELAKLPEEMRSSKLISESCKANPAGFPTDFIQSGSPPGEGPEGVRSIAGRLAERLTAPALETGDKDGA